MGVYKKEPIKDFEDYQIDTNGVLLNIIQNIVIKILKHDNMKKIIGIDIDTNEIIYRFDSLADAGRFFSNGKNYRPYQNSICKVLKGLRRTYKNCYWKYST